MGVDVGPVEPGKVKTVEFVATQPGEYTFYCTEWCDPSHPRMRGVLEVRGSGPDTSGPPPRDAAIPHTITARSAPVVPVARPAASRGQGLYETRCAACHGSREDGAGGPAVSTWDFLSERSPAELFVALRGRDAPGPLHGRTKAAAATAHAAYTADWSDQSAWDVLAYLWSLASPPERRNVGQRLFARSCAACHGERGGGDGPGGRHQPKAPANFRDQRRMLAGTSELYLATIRRGGMGSGMPYWGAIFTEDEMRALVDRVWSFSLGTWE
jgi:cbb3-type cytochrome c oxidase subunit III